MFKGCGELKKIPSFVPSFSFLYLKELHSDAGEHELEQRGDDDDVADGPDCHKHALHHMLQNTPEMTVSIWMPLLFFKCVIITTCVSALTFSPLALLMALSGLSTLSTLRIFTTLIALDLKHARD